MNLKALKIKRVSDSEKGKEVFTIMVLSDSVEVTDEMFKEQWTSYYSFDEACEDAERLAKSIAKNEPDFDDDTVVLVMGGEYEKPSGDVYGEPFDIKGFKISDYR